MSRDRAYLLDILLAARQVQELAAGMSFAEFAQNRTLQLAISHLITIIGEAARGVSSATKGTHPEIPWHDITGMRNRLVHEYFRINLRKVWDTVEVDIPELIRQIEPLVPPEDTV